VEASVLVESQKYQEALKHFETALNLDPRRADGWLNKGFAHSKLDQHFDALHCLEECIKIEPDYWEAWMLKAGTLLALKRKDEAIGSFRRVAEGTNNLDASIRSQAINAMGELELNEGRLAAADSTIIQMPGICSCHSQVLGVSEALTFRGFIRRRTMLLQRPSFAMGNLFGAIGANLNKFLTDLFDLPNSGI
jgi:tetratricopeptide (TPR) repeat protein